MDTTQHRQRHTRVCSPVGKKVRFVAHQSLGILHRLVLYLQISMGFTTWRLGPSSTQYNEHKASYLGNSIASYSKIGFLRDTGPNLVFQPHM